MTGFGVRVFLLRLAFFGDKKFWGRCSDVAYDARSTKPDFFYFEGFLWLGL